MGSVRLSSAADLEGHFAPTDRRRYIVDFSRALPPDVESVRVAGVAEAIYARLLRPELVMRNPEPLNPDAFSGFKGSGSADVVDEFASDCQALRVRKYCYCCRVRLLTHIISVALLELTSRAPH